MTPISVLVVDDSVVVRRMVADVLSADPGIRVVGTAPNGRVALAKLDQLAPDLVTLDIEMPELDGIATLRELRKDRPRLPVIMFSTLTAAGATATLDALAAGASDYVTKPSNVGSIAASLEAIRSQLVPRIYALCGPRPAAPAAAARPTTTPILRPARAGQAPQILAIGASTGGPDALNKVLAALPATFPVPVVIVQHMPPLFTRLFSERLDRTCSLHVAEAVDGEPLRAGSVLIAPGDHHLEVVRRGTQMIARLHQGPPENFCRPAVDVLFRSVAAAYGDACLSVVLTGMGQDGRRGAELLVAAGSQVIAQDAATSVVWGMPGAVATAGLASLVLPLGEIAAALIHGVVSPARASALRPRAAAPFPAGVAANPAVRPAPARRPFRALGAAASPPSGPPSGPRSALRTASAPPWPTPRGA